jgi:GT2 family glycosyltransferase
VTISALIVSYDEKLGEIRGAIDGLLSQTRVPDEVLVVDNGRVERLGDELDRYSPRVKVIRPGSNLGYAGGVNLGAASAAGDYLVCLNPDAHPEVDCVEKLAAAADTDELITLVGAQILLDDGLTRNAGANPVHPTGISPAGGYGQKREQGEPHDVAMVSGACFLMRRASFLELGGFVDELFMYYDDVDIAWRARIAGKRVVYCPGAAAVHSYEFSRRGRKWFLLERNRLFSVLANYEARTLLLLAPLLLATELGLLAVALREGWLTQKLASYRSLLALRKRLLAERRTVQGSRRRSDAGILDLVDDRLDSALLSTRGVALANAFCVPYMAVVRRLLSAGPHGT